MYASFIITRIHFAGVVLLKINMQYCASHYSFRKIDETEPWLNLHPVICLFLENVFLECIASLNDMRLYIHVYSCT